MSSSLQFYAINWADMSAAIGCHDRRVFRAVLRDVEEEFDEVYGAEDFDGGPDIEMGIERWIQGEINAQDLLKPFRVTSLGDILGFVSLVKHFGQLVGTINHTSAAAPIFIDEFLNVVLRDTLKPPFPVKQLTERPIAGYLSGGVPTWGGLSVMEIEPFAGQFGVEEAPVWPADPNIDEWLEQFWDALRSVVDVHKDLICIYG